MLAVTLGLVFTAILIGKASTWGRQRASDMGTMSGHWVAANQMSRTSSN